MPCVYQLTNSQGKSYVGSTMYPVMHRVNQHVHCFRHHQRTGAGYNSGAYEVLSEWPHIAVEIVEEHTHGSITREELHQRERMRYEHEKDNPDVQLTNRLPPGRNIPLSDERKARMSEKIECTRCGACVSRRHIARHHRTFKCRLGV